MKRSTAIRLLTLAAALLILGVSCYWTPQDEENVEGSLSLDMSSISTQADISSGSDTARVYLLAERGKAQGLYPLGDGEDYVDVDVDDTLTIDGIAPGFSYRVLISFGTDHGSWFEVTEYAESDPVEVESGAQAEVEVSVEASPFVYPGGTAAAVNGKELNGVVVRGGVFVADQVNVYELATNLQSEQAGSPQVLGASINSLSRGDAYVLANTSSGIFYGTTVTNIDDSQTDYVGNVTESVQFSSNDILFQGPGVLGGATDIGSAVSNWTIIDVSDVIAGTPIRDYALNGGTLGSNLDVAVVSAFGTFSATNDDFDGADDWDTVSESLLPFFDEIVPERILSVGYGFNGSGNGLLFGTDSGLFDESGNGPLFDTDNTIVSDVAAGSDNEMAFLGPYYLFIYDGSSVQRYPFVAGFPGNPNDMTWGGSTLYITGDEGIVSISP